MVTLAAPPNLAPPTGLPPGRFASSGRAFVPKPVFYTCRAGTWLYRFYRPSAFAPTATTFRFNGPRARFDHQRGDASKAAWVSLPDEEAVPVLNSADDIERGVLYAAFGLPCCIVEVFDALSYIEPAGWIYARLTVTRDLKLLDLRGRAAMRVGTVAAISKRRHAMSQAWSRYFYEDPAFEDCDGLLYNAAHNNERAVALYERAAGGLTCTSRYQIPLNSRRLRRRLLQAAEDHNLALSLSYLAAR